MRKTFKNEIGITLITLVITIVVLIILATVSIGVLGGENGIIKKSKYAKEQTEIAQEIDILKISTALAMGENPQGNVTEINLRNELDKNIKNYTLETQADKFKVTFESGREYIVDIDGNVSQNGSNEDGSGGNTGGDTGGNEPTTNPKVIYNYNGATSGNTEIEKQLIYGSTYGTLPNPSKTVTVTYEYNGATGGNEKTIDTSTFTFGGWYKESTFKNQVTESTQVTTTSNHTLYAKWTGGGITLPTPTKDGYTFECWCTDPGLSNSVGIGGTIYNATSSVTLYAKWTQNPIITYTVTYNKNTEDSVENMPTNQTKTQGVNLTLSDLVPTRTGYTFNGWSTNISQTEAGEYQPGATFSLDTNVTLYVVWKKAGASSIEIAQNATEYYGKVIDNYKAVYDDTSGSNAWRIFMADEDNIYLIADDYIHYKYAPSKNGKKLERNSHGFGEDYALSMDYVTWEYSGASNIDSAFGSKWLSTYWNAWGSTSTEADIRAVAYILDTQIWNMHYKAGYENLVEYVIGGPTIEMYCKSYKDTHPTRYIECENVDSHGYLLRWNDSAYGTSIKNGIPENEFGRIYMKTNYYKCYDMWLASPGSNYGHGELLTVGCGYISAAVSNGIDSGYCNYDTGFCPIVCLKKGCKLEKNESSESYKIIY